MWHLVWMDSGIVSTVLRTYPKHHRMACPSYLLTHHECVSAMELDSLTLADPTPHSIYPGQSINISAVVVGQDFGTVSGSVYAQFLHISPKKNLPQLKPWQKVQAVMQHNSSNLYYTILPQSDIPETTLVLTAHDSYVSTSSPQTLCGGNLTITHLQQDHLCIAIILSISISLCSPILLVSCSKLTHPSGVIVYCCFNRCKGFNVTFKTRLLAAVDCCG